MKDKFVIKTRQGEAEITWPRNEQPGFCPNCHKCVPFNSILIKKENGDSEEDDSDMEAVKAKKPGIKIGQFGENAVKIGECPYCHQAIPVREVILKTPGGIN
ncbi:hypothetical protein [Lacrimispora defluvii]|uniref:Uncharacterized protein n=1 Tax=Lacrimispora defluvii TaxID=2719233 RepID=A0ABX1VTY4_9FIRM|nr:hypothetical protein [Lacrimispora defluvii]NNJ30845.1 hypothetical protein [Lacrimispora defluvii]